MVDPLDRLGEKIDTLKERKAEEEVTANEGNSGAGMGMRVGVELLGGVAVGGFLGWHIDNWLATRPFFFIICLLFGAAGGGLSIYRISKRMNDQ